MRVAPEGALARQAPHPAPIARSDERAFFQTPYCATFSRRGRRSAISARESNSFSPLRRQLVPPARPAPRARERQPRAAGDGAVSALGPRRRNRDSGRARARSSPRDRNRGVSVAEIADRDGVGERAMRKHIRTPLARRRRHPACRDPERACRDLYRAIEPGAIRADRQAAPGRVASPVRLDGCRSDHADQSGRRRARAAPYRAARQDAGARSLRGEATHRQNRHVNRHLAYVTGRSSD